VAFEGVVWDRRYEVMDAVVGREMMCEKRVDSGSRPSSFVDDGEGLVDDGEGRVVLFRGVDISVNEQI